MIRDGSSGSAPATRTSVDHETAQAPVTEQTSTKKVPVTVEIGGTKLSIKTDRTPDDVAKLAQFIDDKLLALQNAAPSVKREKLLIMLSMTIAEELFEKRVELDQLKTTVQTVVGNCLSIIDDGETELI